MNCGKKFWTYYYGSSMLGYFMPIFGWHRVKCGDVFYIEVWMTILGFLPNVLRNRFYALHSCPTPRYGQIVYRYTRKDDHLQFVWSVPDYASCVRLKMNALSLMGKERKLLTHVLNFYDGTLLRIAQQYNGELDG